MYQIISEKNDNLIVKMPDFDPTHTFLCGQCFRWSKEEDGSWIGIAHGRTLRLSWDGEACTFFNMDKHEFINIWVKYFDLETNYGAIKKTLAKKDEHLREAVVHGHGIRLLNQDFIEVLFSFLISQNNNIPRIKQIIKSLSHNFGKLLDSNFLYGFPDIPALASASIDSLNVCRGGYRCRYISDTAKKLRDTPDFADDIHKLPKGKARELLLTLPGIGPKVADCVLLYSGIDRTVFPIDRWVKRVIETLYLKKEADEKTIRDFAEDYFGDMSGIAQQYLFYYALEKKIGL